MNSGSGSQRTVFAPVVAGVALTAALLASLLPFATAAAAAPTVVPATGGTAISADTAASGPYTTLSGPSLTGHASGDLTGTITLTIPSGFVFNAGVGSAATSGEMTCGTLALSGPIGVTTTTVTVTLSGSATGLCSLVFSGLQVKPTSGTSLAVGSILANGSGLTDAAAGTLTEVPGAPVLTFKVQPSATATAATAFAQQPVVHDQDANGNARAGDAIALALHTASIAGASLSCTTNPVTTNASGDAMFAGCKIDKAPGTFTLRASTLSSFVDSDQITTSVGAATKLDFVSYPANPTASLLNPQPAVAIEDAGGNTVTSAATTTITLTANAGTLACSGGNSKPTSAGVATFSGCALTAGTGRTLTADDGVGGFAAVTGASFDVTSGIASRLAFTTQPAGAVAAGTTTATAAVPFSPQPIVAVEDATGATVTSDNATVVTLSLEPGTPIAGGPGTLTCTGGLSKTVTSGVAAFSGCSLDKVGTGYRVRATASPALTIATSNAFSIVAGAATQLGFSTQPPSSVTAAAQFPVAVAIEDAGGNIVTTAAATSIMLALGTNPAGGTLTCTGGNTKTTTSGVASFTCSVDKPGVGYTLTADDGAGGFAAVTSSPFTVGVATGTLTISASAHVVTYGQSVVLTVGFGAVGANRTISIEHRLPSLEWTAQTSLTTDATGTGHVTVTPHFNTQYRAVWAGAADLAAATSPAVRVLVRPKGAFAPGGTIRTLLRGTRITYSTTVRPIVPSGHQTVTYLIYRRVAGHWVFVTSATIRTDSAGRARFTRRWSAGDWYIRARINATAWNVAILSAIARVHVR